MKKAFWIGIVAAALAGCGGGGGSNGGGSLPSRRIVAVTTDGHLVTLDSDAPGTYLSDVTITGLAGGETPTSLDRRPATGALYLMTSSGNLYTLNAVSGAATSVGDFGTPAGTVSEIDFNPTVDRIRFGTNSAQNLRINPDTGAQVDADPVTVGTQEDGAFNYADARDNEIVGLAYTNSVAGAATTTLYAIDAAQQTLVTLATPNNGILSTVGDLDVAIPLFAPFDIANGDDFGLVAISSGGRSRIGSVDLASGHVRRGGQTPTGSTIVGLAILPPS